MFDEIKDKFTKIFKNELSSNDTKEFLVKL